MNFDNVNTNVTRRKVGSTYGKNITNKNLIDVPVREKYDNGSKALQESMEKFKNANIKANKQKLDKISDQRFFTTTLNEHAEKLKDDLFCDILHQICVESMVIDEGPLYDNLENICNIIDNRYKEIGGFKAIKENAKKTGNLLLSKMVTICEETVKEVTDRNLKDKKDKKELSFDLSKDEKDDFNYKKGEIGIESIINNVKSKVIDVVKEEKKSNEEKSEMIEEIKTELGDAEVASTDMSDTSDNNPEPEQETSDDTETENVETEETDMDNSEGEDINENTETENEKAKKQKKDDNKLSDEDITEALSFIFDDKIETTTLFESLMRKNYKALLENSKSIIFESCGDNEVCDSEDKKPKTKDKEYKLSELDVFDKDEEDFDDETDEDLMISENRQFAIENLSPEKIDELENYISEGIKIRTRPGNLGLSVDFDTGVGDIVRAAQTDVHYIDNMTLPGFKNKMINLIKSCKNGADVAYVNQLVGLPFRTFKNPGFTGYLESYNDWLKYEYKSAYDEVIEKLNIKFEPIAENLKIKGSLLGYRPVDNVFLDNARDIIYYMQNEDIDELQETFEKIGNELESVVEGCKSSKKKVRSCKEAIRKLQKDTEEMEEESTCSKKAKEACNPKKACESTDTEKIKDELSEMLVCPDCGKDPCVCDKENILNEYTVNRNVNNNINTNMNNNIKNNTVNSTIDAHGSINYNKIAAAGLIAGAGGAAYGGYKLNQHKIKKLCQREVGVNGELNRWQKKIMKQINKVKNGKKAKDVIELKIAIKNDIKTLEKGKKKNPEYKVMIDNQIKWYNNVALKSIAEIEKSFNISEDYEYFSNLGDDYLFEDYLFDNDFAEYEENIDYNPFEESEFGLGTFSKSTLESVFMEDDDEYEDDDDDDDEYEDDDDDDDEKKCEEYYYFDIDANIDELNYRQYVIEQYISEMQRPEGLEIVEDAIDDDISRLVKTRNLLKNDPTYNEYVEKINNYIQWLQTSANNLLISKKKELDGDPMVETTSNFDYIAEGKKIGKLQQKLIKTIDKRNLASLAKRDWYKVQKRMEKKVKRCKTIDDVNYLETDLKQGDIVLKRTRDFIKNDPSGKYTDRLKPLEDYMKWGKTEYPALLKQRKKEIKAALKEQSDFEEWLDDFHSNLIEENSSEEQLEEGLGGNKYKRVESKLYGKQVSKHAKKVYLKKISKIKDEKTLKMFREGFKQTKKEYNLMLKQNTGNQDYIKSYLKWLDDVAKPALDAKEKELKQKKVTESFLNKLDDLCENLNEFIDTHEEARQIALESLNVNFNNKQVFAPILNEYDINKDNLYLAYKLKYVCEGLKGLIKDASDPIQMKQAKRLLEYNMNQIDEMLYSVNYDNVEYKCNILTEAHTYLTKLSDRSSVIMESLIIESDYIEPQTITEAIEVVDDIINASRINLVTEQTNREQMEVVMAEAIVDYTIMEAFNTLKLTNYKHEDVKKMIRENLNM